MTFYHPGNHGFPAPPLPFSPHRPHCSSSSAHKRVVAIKNVTMNEPFFQGHFPGAPLMPGVLVD